MARTSIPTPDEALAGMAKVGAPRKPMGTDAFKASAAQPKQGKLVPKKHGKSVDPAQQPTSARNKIVVNAGVERLGAKYSPQTTFGASSPEAAATQANGRIVSPSVVRSRQSFDSGSSTSY